nr:hypothetical protein [Marinicella sp. W31]MDC2877014.1 hypothetical protein [Marinicella sp. W31]
MIRLPLLSGLAIAAVATAGWADMPASAVTPDVVQTSRGTFEFKDVVPTQETSQALRDQNDFTFA